MYHRALHPLVLANVMMKTQSGCGRVTIYSCFGCGQPLVWEANTCSYIFQYVRARDDTASPIVKRLMLERTSQPHDGWCVFSAVHVFLQFLRCTTDPKRHPGYQTTFEIGTTGFTARTYWVLRHLPKQ